MESLGTLSLMPNASSLDHAASLQCSDLGIASGSKRRYGMDRSARRLPNLTPVGERVLDLLLPSSMSESGLRAELACYRFSMQVVGDNAAATIGARLADPVL